MRGRGFDRNKLSDQLLHAWLLLNNISRFNLIFIICVPPIHSIFAGFMFFNFINSFILNFFFMKQIIWYMYLMQNADFSKLLVSWLSCYARSISSIPPPPRRVNMQFWDADQAICSILISALEFLYLFQLFLISAIYAGLLLTLL